MNTAFSSLPVLLVDDDPTWLRGFRHNLILSLQLRNVSVCEDSRKAMALIAAEAPALAVLDVTMPHINGEELLGKIREEYPCLPVIMLTGRNQVEIAVRCMKLGAFDYCVKTDELERLVGSVRNALHLAGLERENQRLLSKVLAEELGRPEVFAGIVTHDRAMFAMFRYLEAIAESSEPLLIYGESGTGKELIARALHRLAAPKNSFVTINIAGLDDHMFSDTLFGHRRGAFTGAVETRRGLVEQAGNGILFLDEIGDLGIPSQVKLLRLLQESEYLPLGCDRAVQSRCRIICATNRDLTAGMEEGWFRKDLYYRLRTHQVHLPPLRQRHGDIALLLRHFWQQSDGAVRKKFDDLPEEIRSPLLHYNYPGNIRELRGMVLDIAHRIFDPSFSAEALRTLFHLPAADAKTQTTGPLSMIFPTNAQLPTLKEGAWFLIEEALERSGGNQTVAARMLGVSRAAMSKRLKSKE